MVGVDRADAAVAEDVVAAEEEFAQPKRELAVRMAGRVPDFELEIADRDAVPLVDQRVDLTPGAFPGGCFGLRFRQTS